MILNLAINQINELNKHENYLKLQNIKKDRNLKWTDQNIYNK